MNRRPCGANRYGVTGVLDPNSAVHRSERGAADVGLIPVIVCAEAPDPNVTSNLI